MSDMNAIQIARRLAELGQTDDAAAAYTLAIGNGLEPQEELEAAVYLFRSGGDYRVAYTSFHSLYNRGHFKEDLLALMTSAFYTPNIKLMQTRYEKNCKALEKYPYLFRKDFLPFEWLPIQFYPYDDNGYVPFDREAEHFDDYINFNHPVISQNFFKNLDKPILAHDVYSQYELEYLNDNVRRSEWVGRENHIYLHYSSWGTFCAHLAVLNIRELLKEKKIVFLIEDEVEQYPIDFKERFGIDYSECPVRPIGIGEVNRLIWHTQLAAHNGGDFFNEIFDEHPNLIVVQSIMMENVEKNISKMRENIQKRKLTTFENEGIDEKKIMQIMERLLHMHAPTDKDLFVAFCMCVDSVHEIDPAERIVPTIFFQPHFHNIFYTIQGRLNGPATLDSEQYDAITKSRIFRSFRYIKTFTPIRRPTRSTGATMRYVMRHVEAHNEKMKPETAKKPVLARDVLRERFLNRSFMIDTEDHLFKDSVMLRFEDGKLNPKATFTALAAFLDIPYTESMTYCSVGGDRQATGGRGGDDLGFGLGALQRTYSEFFGDSERCLLEYALRDLYAYCGYDFEVYDGKPIQLEELRELSKTCNTMDEIVFESSRDVFIKKNLPENASEQVEQEVRNQSELTARQYVKDFEKQRVEILAVLNSDLRFINKNGQPLKMMPLLKLDPALLEQPLYH